MNEFIVAITTWVTPTKQSFVLKMKIVSDSSRIFGTYLKAYMRGFQQIQCRGSFIKFFFPLYHYKILYSKRKQTECRSTLQFRV